MPQASDELRDRWPDDSAAFAQLRGNFRQTRGGIIRPMPGYTPTDDDFSAIAYLIHEWDYGYDPSPAGSAP
ncbi:hypothetical protein DF159_20870 [Burkholderia ubonensis]|uniref:hypothetical protein n=1 Tax=Burkholderia ubonensis TaxID=101571 RepID=UPI000F570C0D|nr:hypothetical protein [Burkholderia ubonensis]RQP57999.1 hypothetical protein DF159_20870 [Burkholderia ubonensis]